MGSDRAGWAVMGLALGAMYLVVIVLLNVPEWRPSDEVLACDSLGGHWSSADGECHLSDSPAAGMAS